MKIFNNERTRDGMWMTAVPILQILCGSVYYTRGQSHVYEVIGTQWVDVYFPQREWPTLAKLNQSVSNITLYFYYHCNPVNKSTLPYVNNANSDQLIGQIYSSLHLLCVWIERKRKLFSLCGFHIFFVCMQCYIIAQTFTLKWQGFDWLIGS